MGDTLAVIATGGKQYLVEPGSVVRVEKLLGKVGDAVTFRDILLVARGEEVSVGAPRVMGATVTGAIVAQGRARKVIGVKFKPKKRQRTAFGHRQRFTEVKIHTIEHAGVTR